MVYACNIQELSEKLKMLCCRHICQKINVFAYILIYHHRSRRMKMTKNCLSLLFMRARVKERIFLCPLNFKISSFLMSFNVCPIVHTKHTTFPNIHHHSYSKEDNLLNKLWKGFQIIIFLLLSLFSIFSISLSLSSLQLNLWEMTLKVHSTCLCIQCM